MALMTTSIKSEHRFSPSPPSVYHPLYQMADAADLLSRHATFPTSSSSRTRNMDRNNDYLMPPGFNPHQPSDSRDQKRRRHSPTNSVSSQGRSGSSHNERTSPSPGLEDQEQPCGEHLLRFKSSVQAFPLLNHLGNQIGASIAGELGGMFFLAESGLGDEDASKTPATYLTCYRRNLFQVTGSVIISNSLQYIVTDQGARIPVIGQELSISATESVEGKSVKLISVPWKSTIEHSSTVESKEAEPQVLPIEIPLAAAKDGGYMAIPISWKRLQFRIATANNGRRKELQQHFLVHLRLSVILANGARVGVADARSDPIIVRGRSPRNFQSRKEYALSGSSSRSSARHSASASISTSTGSSRASGSPATQALETLDTTAMLPYQLSPMQQMFENSAPHVPSTEFIFDGQQMQFTPSYPAWSNDNTAQDVADMPTLINEPLFSPMAELYLKQPQEVEPEDNSMEGVILQGSSSRQSVRSSSAQQMPSYSDSESAAGILGYQYSSGPW